MTSAMFCNEVGCTKHADMLIVARVAGVARYAANACYPHVGSQMGWALGSADCYSWQEAIYTVTHVRPPKAICGSADYDGTRCTHETFHRGEHSYEPNPF